MLQDEFKSQTENKSHLNNISIHTSVGVTCDDLGDNLRILFRERERERSTNWLKIVVLANGKQTKTKNDKQNRRMAYSDDN